jgi:hypothetical protein
MKRYELLIVSVIAIIVLLICVTALRAEDKPTLTDAEKLSIRTQQNELKDIQIQMMQLEKQYQQLQALANDKQKVFADDLKKIFANHKLVITDYELDKDLNLNKIKKPEAKK